MDPVMIAAMAFMTLTDQYFKATCPPGEDLTEWRAKVTAKCDAEENWLESIIAAKQR